MTGWRGRSGPPTLIASDVDGTLVDDRNRVRPLTAEAVRRADAAGVPLVLATGRPPRWLAEIAEQLPTSAYAVCANGAILYDISADRVLSSSTLPPDDLARLADVAYRCLPGCGLAAERPGLSANDPGADDSATAPFVATPGYEHAWLNPDHLQVDEHDVIAEPAVKLLVRSPGLRSGDMAAAVSDALADAGLTGRADITFSTENGLVELAPAGVTKASGLRTISEIALLSTDYVVAFGDMPNDIEMLRWADHGVAMANAHPDVRATADEIATGNDNDGVGRVLWRWFG